MEAFIYYYFRIIGIHHLIGERAGFLEVILYTCCSILSCSYHTTRLSSAEENVVGYVIILTMYM